METSTGRTDSSNSSALVDLLLQELKQERGARAELQEAVWRLEAAAAAGTAAQQHAPGKQSRQWQQQQQQTAPGRCCDAGAAAAPGTQGCAPQPQQQQQQLGCAMTPAAAAGISTPRLLPAAIAAPSFVCTSPSSPGSSPSSLALSAAAAQLLSTAAAARVRNSQQLLAESLTLSGSSSDSDNADYDGGSRRGSRQPHSSFGSAFVGRPAGRAQHCDHDTNSGAGLAPAWVQPGPCSQAGAAAAAAAAAQWPATGVPPCSATVGSRQTSSSPDDGGSWPDSWDGEINTFCASLLPPGAAVAGDMLGGELPAPLGFAGRSNSTGRIGVQAAAAAASSTSAWRDDDAQPVGATQQRRRPLPLQPLVGSTWAPQPEDIASITGPPNAGAATGSGSMPGCQRCEQLSALLLEQELECELQAAQLSLLSEERDLLALQHESLLQIIVAERQLQQS